MNNISKEDYLSVIFKFQNRNGEIRPKAIAQKLQVTQAAVTDMLKKLAIDNYILYEKYKCIRLTPSGEEFAINMVRRHRIWEVFLQKVVGMPWDKVHEEAHKLEHSSSDDLINRLEVLLRYPEFDPHGDPIPSKEGKIPKIKKYLPLSDLKEGESGTVVRVNDFDEQFLNYLTELGISLYEIILVKEKRNFDNSLMIQIKGKQWNISQKLAENIFIEIKKVKGA
ncbi:MAG: metal-dependent transcriptional regulator [Ignavibacteriaceae bacterium]|nr:metal-dependent transcriptional regulator [Ignavibacteriaceae bacterium]